MWSFVDYRGPDPKMCLNKNSLYDFIQGNANFSKFKKVVDTANMAGILDDIQANVTLCIPSNDFLTHLPDSFFDTMDDGYAREILNSSIIHRRIDKSLITSSPVAYYNTRNPRMRMYVTNIGGVTRINNCVSVVKYDMLFENGIIHVVDGLIAPSEDTFMN